MSSFFNLQSEVIIGNLTQTGLSNWLNNHYAECKKVIFVDSNTMEYCLPLLINFIDGLENAEIIEIPSGEENKTMEICFSVWESLTEYEFTRSDLFICLGGGMICDMGGFISSLYKRGMNCIYIPTSLLAMVDASIGGKTGIDMGPYKNHLGVFSFPKKVYIDIDFLNTLPQREIINGWAEMLKHALVADADHYTALENFDVKDSIIPLDWVEKSLMIKHEIVESDPKESGRRKLLNFGHTIGHAIEGVLLNSEHSMDHGLAVAHGILVEAKISRLLNRLTSEEFERIEKSITKTFELRKFDEDFISKLPLLMRQDKKRKDNKFRFTLLSGIGSGEIDVVVDESVVFDALQVLL